MRLTCLSIFSICFSIVLQAQISKTLNLNAGNLSALLTTEEKSTVTGLILTGNIDARDFKTMRDEMPVLEEIDISEVTILEYDGATGPIASSTNYPENTIPEQAFFNSFTYNGKNRLKRIILPSSVTSIGKAAFSYCSNLNSVILPDSLTNIGESAFGACQSLGSVEIPNSVTFIGSSTFWGCTKLDTFSFRVSVTSIEYNSFNNSG